jgi:hypothetical protein
MFDYLQKFNSLPQDLRERVSSPSAMLAISNLENKYRVDLAMVVMKIMIKGIAIPDLTAYFISELGLTPTAATELTADLKAQVLFAVADYLGLAAEKRAFDLDQDINLLIKAASLSFASDNLVSRFRNIIGTYFKGVRGKIDTRNSLAKDVKIGGLNLSPAEIDRVFKACDNYRAAGAAAVTVAAKPPVAAASSLPRLAPKPPVAPVAEYDLKQALASGQVQTKVKTSETAKITAPVAQLDLPGVQPAPAQVLSSAPVSAPAPAPAPAPVKAAPKIFPTAKSTMSSLSPLKSVAPSAALPKKNIVPDASKPSFWSKFKFSRKSTAVPVAPKAVVPNAPVKPVVKPVVKAVVAAPLHNPTFQPSISISRPAPAPSAARPQMHDIKPVPKVMGPIEELQYLDVVNFRRLGATPAETTAKIFNKIKLLERDGYDKMVAGVQAWRQSPVNRLYLRLGQEAVAKGLSFRDAIAARQQDNKEYLSLAEVEAILSLNSKLAF